MIQWDAKFTGFKQDIGEIMPALNRTHKRITVFTSSDRKEAITKVIEAANQYGYKNVTVDHIIRIR